MRIIQTLMLLIVISTWSCKTTKTIPSTSYNSGKLTYTIDIDANSKMVKDKFGTAAVIEFNTDLLKFTKNSSDTGFEYQLIELKENKTWNYLNFLGNKFRIPEDEPIMPKMGAPTFHDEFLTIAGFKCQKMTASMGDGTMIAYLTKELNANFCPYLDVEGFAMSYSLPMPFGDVTYTATNFENTNPTLSVDNNYTTYSSLKEFQASITENTSNLIGQAITDLNIKDIIGLPLNSDQLKNKVTVFNFWFTSCPPCITEIPDLNKLKAKYKGKEVQFLAITFDDEETVRPFLKKHTFDYRIFIDQQDLINQLKIRSFPTTFITDKSGIIIHSESGGSFSIFEDLDAIIDTALKQL